MIHDNGVIYDKRVLIALSDIYNELCSDKSVLLKPDNSLRGRELVNRTIGIVKENIRLKNDIQHLENRIHNLREELRRTNDMVTNLQYENKNADIFTARLEDIGLKIQYKGGKIYDREDEIATNDDNFESEETINIEFDKLPDYVRDYYTKENRTRSDYKEIIGQLEHDIMLINLRLTCPKLYFPNEDSIPEVIKNKDVLELILNCIQNEFDVDLIDESEENDGYVWGTNNAKKSSNNNEITW